MTDKDMRRDSDKLRVQASHHDFMMRGEEEVFLAMMDKLGVKLDPKELRDFDLNNLQ